jgi:hypothetical protein
MGGLFPVAETARESSLLSMKSLIYEKNLPEEMSSRPEQRVFFFHAFFCAPRCALEGTPN